ncbi:MAG: class I SAM-dependent methyltransferase [Myxococcota bacterium]
MSTLQDNRAYYDAFSQQYERHRHDGYHAMLDDLEADLVLRYARGGRVLEAGCGTGLVLSRLQPHCAQVVGVDLSGGMLRRAADRGLAVAQANILAIPLPDAQFDAVCCFKVLAHIERIEEAMRELGRLVKPGGVLVAEFYNPNSVRGLLWRIKRPGRVASHLHEKNVYVRFDTPADVDRLLPPGFRRVDQRGARVVTVVPQAHRLPVVGPALRAVEERLADPLASLGSFYSVVARREA